MRNNYAFIHKHNSANDKLGSMSYTYAPKENCDPDCPFMDKCYAHRGNVGFQWLRHQSGESKPSCTYPQMLANIRALPAGDKVRLWIGGDFPRNGTGGADCSKATQIAKSCSGKQVIVYSHHQPWSGNGAWGATVRNLAATGFRINISCETESQVDTHMADGISCVITVPSTETRKQWRTKAGNRIRVCPNQIDKAITCDTCMLCHSRPDDMAIAFKAHGNHRQINSILEAIS